MFNSLVICIGLITNVYFFKNLYGYKTIIFGKNSIVNIVENIKNELKNNIYNGVILIVNGFDIMVFDILQIQYEISKLLNINIPKILIQNDNKDAKIKKYELNWIKIYNYDNNIDI